MADPVIRIHPADDVVIARVRLLGGKRIDGEGISVAGLVPPGRRIAVRASRRGRPMRHGGQMDNNPVAGNKAGGLTTILEKSLGAVAKSGTTNLVEVHEYAEPVTAKGTVFMDTPGFDPVSATGQVAGGANLICFTTGRGSANGCAPAPPPKLATSTALWLKQDEGIDVNCGEIVDGTARMDEMGERIFRLMLATASCQTTKSERRGCSQNEFVPWPLGAIM